MENTYKTLLEASRKELIDKSKSADIVKRYGTTRYERRKQQHVYNSVEAFNRVDMNSLFQANLLSFTIPVHGETDNYGVVVLFEGICDSIKREVLGNHDELEFKCVYRALIDAINKRDVFVACSCPDWKYRFAYVASRGDYNGGRPEIRAADITNPHDSKGCGCKHVMNVLDNLDWAVKLATAIYNYIIYMKENYEDKYTRLIHPVIHKKPYEPEVEVDHYIDEPDDELNVDNQEELPDEEEPEEEVDEE